MFTTNRLADLFKHMAILNEFFWPLHIPAAALAVILTFWCFVRPGTASTKSMQVFLSVLYAVIAYGISVCAVHLQTGYYIFDAALHWGIVVLLVAGCFQKKIRFGSAAHKGLKIVSGLLILYGIFIYYGVELLVGYTWPAIFTFGAQCPSTIFTIGVLLTVAPTAYQSSIYKMLLGLLSFGAVVCASYAILIGGLFDISYLISGLIGFYVLFKYRRPSRPLIPSEN